MLLHSIRRRIFPTVQITQNKTAHVLAFKNKTYRTQIWRNTCQTLKILVATQYSKIYSHLCFSDIISCSIMASRQYMILYYIHPVQIESLLVTIPWTVSCLGWDCHQSNPERTIETICLQLFMLIPSIFLLVIVSYICTRFESLFSLMTNL